MPSLAVKYRPQTFEEVCGQSSIITILKRQLELSEFKNCYLFCGPSGTGKTTLARIFASKINNEEVSSAIEIDGASNNGVDNIRHIIENAQERAIATKYKVIIIDEAHMITIAGWNAFLKCLEEPPKYSIFIFCTTDPQKIPSTILNRLMRFNLIRVNTSAINNRLKYICKNEHFSNYDETCDYISKLSCGGVRDAISLLEKVSSYSSDLDIINALSCLGNFSYNTFFDLTNFIYDRKESEIIKLIDNCYADGKDVIQLITQYMDFVLDLTKYCMFNDISLTKIPSFLEKGKDANDTHCVRYCTGFDNNINFFNKLNERLLELHFNLKQDTIAKTSVCIALVQISREI